MPYDLPSRKSHVWSGELLDTKAVRALLEQESGASTSNRLPQKGVQKGEVKMVSASKVNHTQKQATYAQPAVTQPFSSYHHRYNRFGSPSKHSGTNSRRTACRSKECESSTLSQLLPQLRALRSIPPRTRPNPLPRWYNSRCEFHSGGVGHDTDNCYNLKHRVQDLIDQKLLIFPRTSLIQNPLPIHEVGSSSTTPAVNMMFSLLCN